MSAASALANGRLAAQALMVDACTIQRQTGSTTADLTGIVTPTLAAVYSGICKFQTVGAGAMGRRFEVGEMPVVMLRIELHVPIVGSETIARGDIVTPTVCTYDSSLVGRTFRVHDLSHKSFATARRLLIEEAT